VFLLDLTSFSEVIPLSCLHFHTYKAYYFADLACIAKHNNSSTLFANQLRSGIQPIQCLFVCLSTWWLLAVGPFEISS